MVENQSFAIIIITLLIFDSVTLKTINSRAKY